MRRPRRLDGDDFADKPRTVPVTKGELLYREMWVENLLFDGTSHEKVVSLARRPRGPVFTEGPRTGMLISDGRPPGLGIGRDATLRTIQRVIDKLVRQSEADRPRNKLYAIQRLYRHMREAKRAGKWSTVLGCERLIADIQGTREPLRLDINLSVNMALMAVVGNLTGEQRDALLAEYEEMEYKAKLYTSNVPPSMTNGTAH